MPVSGVTTLVPGERVPLAPVDVEPQHAQTLRKGLELDHGGDLHSRMRLEGRGKRSLHPDVDLGGHQPEVVVRADNLKVVQPRRALLVRSGGSLEPTDAREPSASATQVLQRRRYTAVTTS